MHASVCIWSWWRSHAGTLRFVSGSRCACIREQGSGNQNLGLILDRFGRQDGSFAVDLRVVCAWDPWSCIQGPILTDFGPILEPKVGQKSRRNRDLRVACAWDPWAAWATDFLIDFGSDFHEILMPKTCLKRDKNGCQTSKSFNCQLCDFVKKLRSFLTFQGFDGCCNVTEG